MDTDDVFESNEFAPRFLQPGQYETTNAIDEAEEAERDVADIEAEIAAYLASKRPAAKAHGVRNDVAGLARVRQEIRSQGGWADLPWVETLVVTTAAPVSASITNMEDDFQRELAFYRATLAATNVGLQQVRVVCVVLCCVVCVSFFLHAPFRARMLFLFVCFYNSVSFARTLHITSWSKPASSGAAQTTTLPRC